VAANVSTCSVLPLGALATSMTGIARREPGMIEVEM
jgi:hypothetical protein